MNSPSMYTRLPLFRFFRVWRSSLWSVMILSLIVSSAFWVSAMRVTRLIYRLTGVGTFSTSISISFNKILDLRSSVPSRDELISSKKSRLRWSDGVCGLEGRIIVYEGNRSNIFYGSEDTRPAPFYPLLIF